jgi:uncharacterized YccA/Bax inhibitor family protein
VLIICVLSVMLYVYESWLLARPNLNPSTYSAIVHVLVLIATIALCWVLKVGKTSPLTLLTGFLALVFSLMALQQASMARFREHSSHGNLTLLISNGKKIYVISHFGPWLLPILHWICVPSRLS